MSKTKWYAKPIYLLIALVLVLSLGIVAVPMAGTVEADPAEWYVDGALGTNNVTQGTGPRPDAFKTIQYAINDAGVRAGDTINVAAGTYNETVEVNKEFTLQGEGKDVVTVTAADSDDYIFEVTAHNVTISGFNITGAQKCGVYLDKRRHCEILHNIITANGGYGIYIDKSSDNTISDNEITANGGGINLDSSNNNDISKNDILNNSAPDSGIHLNSASPGNAIHLNNIVGNSPYGVHNEAAEMVDAENNWWGDASGPEDTSGATDCKPPSEGGWNCDVCDENSDGLGDKVSDNVDYCPWLIEPYAPTKSTGTATGTGSVSFSPDTGALEGLTTVDEGNLPEEGKPALEFPHGFFSFNIVGLTPGQTVVVTITLPEDVPEGTEYWKYHEPEGWIDVTSLLGDNDGDEVLTLTLTDGELGDDDGVANGTIVDAGGPANPPPPPPPPVGGEAYPVNKLAILMPWIALDMAVISGVAVTLRHRGMQS